MVLGWPQRAQRVWAVAARSCLRHAPAQALQCLKKKKLLENEIANLDNMIMRVNEQRMMLEGQRTTTEVVSSMHTAALAAKENMKAMKIENVDKVQCALHWRGASARVERCRAACRGLRTRTQLQTVVRCCGAGLRVQCSVPSAVLRRAGPGRDQRDDGPDAAAQRGLRQPLGPRWVCTNSSTLPCATLHTPCTARPDASVPSDGRVPRLTVARSDVQGRTWTRTSSWASWKRWRPPSWTRSCWSPRPCPRQR
jgi:hypothetical protein